MEKQAQLVGGGAGAGGAVGGEMGLPGLDMVLGLAASAIDALVERLARADGEAGDDEARVAALRSGFDAGDDAFHPAPGGGAVMEFLEPPQLAAGRFCAADGGGLQDRDMA